MAEFATIYNRIKEAFLLLFAPESCFCCGEWLGKKEMLLCLDCLHKLKFFTIEHYDCFFEFKPTKSVPVSPEWEHCFPLLRYESGSPESNFIVNIKDHSTLEERLTAGIMLGKRIKLYYKQKNKEIDLDFIIPAPIIKEREAKRGYSQTHDIALGIASELGIEVKSNYILNEGKEFKIRELLSLSTERDKIRTNKYTLHANPEELMGKHILIFDDQITTGGTIYKLYNLIDKATRGNVRISIASLGLNPKCMK